MRQRNAAGSRRRRCVICGRPQDPAWRPFCSKRCQMVDLGRWLQGRYRLPGDEPLAPEAVEEGGEDEALR